MAQNNYTTVKEMTEQVNQMFELLTQAKDLANTLRAENIRNLFALRYDKEEAIKEVRPITKLERIAEAEKYIKLFDKAMGMIHEAIVEVNRNY